MSDFDREAERERLREQFERDKEKREASERMSELLLQGATMTNRHCPECHSPVFRYEDKEFCPTCQREVAREEGEADAFDDGESADAAANGEGVSEEAEPPETEGEPPRTETPSETDSDAGGVGIEARDPNPDGSADAAGTSAHADAPTADPADERAGAREPSAGDETETRPATTGERRPARVDPPARREDPAAGSGDPGDLREAEAALVREITALARRAEETRDVGRKTDLFAAAREAAETLRTIRQL